MRGGTHRRRTVRVAPARHRCRELAAASTGEQGSEEEGCTVASQVRLRRQQPEQVVGDVGVRDLPVGVCRRRRDPGFAAVRSRVPRGVHRHVAWVTLLVPFMSAGSGGGEVPEVWQVSGDRCRS